MLTIYLKEDSHMPYYEQIYEYIKSEIKNGSLPCHTKLPSSRGLAKNLGVSRSTVDNAYAQLQAEGYIEAFPKKGYYVTQIDELINIVPVAYPVTSPKKAKEKQCEYDFSPVGADALSFPDAYWRKLTKECMSYDSDKMFQTSEPQGDYALRKSLANFLHQNRGVNCDVDNIIIGAGSQYLMMILLRLIGRDAAIAMENPAYLQTYQTFCSLEREVIPIDVDKHGMCVDKLEQSQAEIAYVTPSHQYPLGIVMPVSRRTQLLNWANYEPRRYVIEDDYDSEFRYQGKPIPALQSMDKGRKVIYMGSFSKVISPAVRMSYMVLPPVLMERYRQIFGSFPCTVSRLDQSVMTRFMDENYYERHLNRLRNRYKSRHDKLIACIRQWQDKVALSGTNAGSYVILHWRGRMSEEELCQKAQKAGVEVYPVSRHYITPGFLMEPAFLMGFAKMSEEDIGEGIKRLQSVWQ